MADRPKFSVCEFTTPDTSFEEDIKLAQLVDADMGVCEPYLIEGQEEAQAEAMRAAGLRATVCIPDNISPLACDAYPDGPTDIDERVEAMKDSLRRFAPFKPECVVVVTGWDDSFDPKDAHKIAVEGLREAARFARELGIDLSFEPIRHDLGPMRISIPSTLRETEEWVDEIGEPNVGICLDVMNVFKSSDNWIEESERLASRVNSVHVNDWIDPPRGYADRWLPGEGIIPLAEVFAALERGGYDGYYDLEVFAQNGLELDGDKALFRRPPEDIVREGRAGFDKAWEESQR